MSKYSSSKRPLRLRYFELFPTRSDAIKREKEIKRRKSRIYIELLIKNWLKESRVLFSSGFSIMNKNALKPLPDKGCVFILGDPS